jgi:hypothetical protein
MPTELGEMRALEGMYLRDNGLTGTLPTELGRLSALAYWWLGNNAIVGSLPTELGGMTALTTMYAAAADGPSTRAAQHPKPLP